MIHSTKQTHKLLIIGNGNEFLIKLLTSLGLNHHNYIGYNPEDLKTHTIDHAYLIVRPLQDPCDNYDLRLGRFITDLIHKNIPYTIINPTHMATDPTYLYLKLSTITYNIDPDRFEETYNEYNIPRIQ